MLRSVQKKSDISLPVMKPAPTTLATTDMLVPILSANDEDNFLPNKIKPLRNNI